MDNTSRSFMCDSEMSSTVRYLPRLSSSKFLPFSLTVGDNLYVMDAFPKPPNGCGRHSFEVLSNDDDCKG